MSEPGPNRIPKPPARPRGRLRVDLPEAGAALPGAIGRPGLRISGGASVGRMIDQVIDSLESRKRVRESLALVHWPRAVGPQAAAATEPETVRDGVLFIRTRSSAWSHELSLHKARILANLTEALGEPLIRDIVFRASRGVSTKPAPPPAEDPTPQELEAIALEPPEEAELQSRIRALRSLEDERLREFLANRLIRQARLRHWRLEHGWRLCRRCSTVQNEPEDLCPLCRLGL